MRRILVILSVSVGALALGSVLWAVYAEDDSDKPKDPSPTEAPEPDPEPTKESRLPETIPAVASGAHTCAPGTVPFDNPVLHYSLCYPSGFGILNLERASPEVAITGYGAYAVRIASVELWPWRPGQVILEAIQERGGGIVSIGWTTPDIEQELACKPTKRFVASGVLGKICSGRMVWRGGDMLEPSDSGDFKFVVIELPLLQPPMKASDDYVTEGANLSVQIVGRTQGANEVLDKMLDLVASIAPQ